MDMEDRRRNEVYRSAVIQRICTYALPDDAWCCARPSGTEPKIKFYMGVKGSNLADADAKLEELTKAVMEVAGQ